MDDKEILLLLEKLQTGKTSPEDLKKLRMLLYAADESKALIRLMRERYWKDISMVDDGIGLCPYKNEERIKERLMQNIQENDICSRQQNNLFYWITTAAAIGLLILGVIFLIQKLNNPVSQLEWVVVSTSHGERKKVTLNDGSVIQLNGNTKLSYPSQTLASVRSVKLDGEAFFNIAKDTNTPFLVISKDFTTQVVGTSFNIDSDIEKAISVNEGRVNIYATPNTQMLHLIRDAIEKKDDLLEVLERTTNNKVSLSQGEKAQLNSSHQWEVTDYAYKSWLNNELIFFNEPLPQVLKKAYRNYGDSIALDPALAHRGITITFQGKKIEQVLNTLVELSNGKLTQDSQSKIWKITKK